MVVYGRRRIGKTELLEQVYRQRQVLKFEGIRDKTRAEQMSHVMWQLSEYAKNPLLAKVQVNTWVEVFKHIYEALPAGVWTIYFEEIQWLANYKPDFIAELKFAWDNYFKRKKICSLFYAVLRLLLLLIIFCYQNLYIIVRNMNYTYKSFL